MESKQVISLNISIVSYNDAVNRIVELGKSALPAYVCFANVHMVIEAYHNKSFAEKVNNATLVLPDGMPVVKTLKLFYNQLQERVAGMDVMPDLIKAAEKQKLKIFFFGTTDELLDKIRERTEREFPGVNIAGLYSPPFNRPIDSDEYVNMINASGAQLVFVALGCPKQETWMAQHSHKINAVLLGVGGAFPVYAGVASRAPLFMQKSGFEWVYRFFQEPKRLFKRYLSTNPLYVYLVLKTKFFTGVK
jgi:N-acetylglucosaminyldiphosphoundecaprenol N-acetyl-beta-D-mannosaminyltransferase